MFNMLVLAVTPVAQVVAGLLTARFGVSVLFVVCGGLLVGTAAGGWWWGGSDLVDDLAGVADQQ